MARKKPAPGGRPEREGMQVNFRASPDLSQRLQHVATVLGVDLANLARMIVTENLPRYEQRAAEVQALRGMTPPS
jgi:predicted transcriptional regulator